jgi:NADH-quinone oxidoreductase subunit E
MVQKDGCPGGGDRSSRSSGVGGLHVYGGHFYVFIAPDRPLSSADLQNLSCQLMGAEHLLDCLRRKLGIGLGQTTSDGMFTLNEVECIAACEMAPAIQVGEDLYGPLGEKDLDDLIARLRAQAKG